MSSESDRTTLLSHAAHAMLSPISSIYNLTGMILAGMDGHINAKVRRDVDEIARDAATLGEVLEAILDLLRLEQEAPDFAQVEVAKAIRLAVADVELPADSDHSIHIYVAASVKTACADGRMLQKVLCTSLQYVLRLTPTGPISIAASSGRGQIRFCVAPGVSPRPMKRVALAELPRRQLRGVAGIQLMICRRLVRMHGGELWASLWPVQETAGICFSIANDTGPRKT